MKRLLLLLAFFAVAAAPARAQFLLGAHGGYDVEVESGLVGVTAQLQLPNTALVVAPSVDYFFGAGTDAVDETLLAFNLDAQYHFGIDNQVFTPYTGVGVSLLYNDVDVVGSSTDLGAHLSGGAIFGFGNLRPFAGARVRLVGDALTSLHGGVLFAF